MDSLVPVKPEESNDCGENISFDDILNAFSGAEKKKETAKRQELETNYLEWARHFNLLKEQFSEVWDLFGEIEEKVPCWYRGRGGNYGQWGSMGASGWGYNFGAGIHYCGDCKPVIKNDAVGGDKYLIVCYGPHSGSILNGIGDERKLGRDTELDEKLVGLENCNQKSLSSKLEGSRDMLKYLDQQMLRTFIYNKNIGELKGSCGIGFLYDHNLKFECQKLFVMLNRDENIELPLYLTSPDAKKI